ADYLSVTHKYLSSNEFTLLDINGKTGDTMPSRYNTTLFHLPFSVSSPGKLRGRPETDRRILTLTFLPLVTVTATT
ncbi:TPA: hypothetical protein ACF327_004482, partial [Escherichia coli]